MKRDTFVEELSYIQEFAEKSEIYNTILYKSDKTPPVLLNSKYVEVRNYKTEEELNTRVLAISQKEEVIFVNSREDQLMQLVDRVRKLLWQKTSDYPEMFNDKSIQRELLYKNDLYTSVNYMKIHFKDLDFSIIEEKIWLPFILKPLNWVSSSWVVKIKTEKQFKKYLESYDSFHTKLEKKWFSNSDEIIAEENINWNLYSIDYFITENWDIRYTVPLKVTLGTDIDVNDLFVISGIASKEVEKEYDISQVKAFIQRTVKATWMRNTFVHHEFKINKKWVYKTIEINWRIWWRRLPIYKIAYWVNMYSMINSENIEFELQNNVNFLKIWACKNWILKDYNNKMINDIKKLKSFNKIEINKDFIWKEVWLTKNGFWFLWSIQLVNKDNDSLGKDVKFIEENYCELLDIDVED